MGRKKKTRVYAHGLGTFQKCATCRERFYIEYPALYAYRRGQKFFCRYSCMRAYDKKHPDWYMRYYIRTGAEGEP